MNLYYCIQIIQRLDLIIYNKNTAQNKMDLINGILNVADDLRKYKLTTNDFITKPVVRVNATLTQLQVQCDGYALFKPDVVFNNFFNFFNQFSEQVRANPNIILQTVKINFNGFKVRNLQQKGSQGQLEHCFAKFAQSLKRIGKNIKTLWIHTTDLELVTIQDFECLYDLMYNLSEGDIKNENFQDFSLQCANWVFLNGQPNFQRLRQALARQKEEMGLQFQLCQTHIRLQLSGWYNTIADAKAFLGFACNLPDLQQVPKNHRMQYQKLTKPFNLNAQTFDQQVQLFHTDMVNLVTNFITIMINVKQLQIDMRNTHQLLKMGKLKNKIITIANQSNKGEKSMNSFKLGQKDEKQINALRLNIMM